MIRRNNYTELQIILFNQIIQIKIWSINEAYEVAYKMALSQEKN
jgi:hypothetical protein